MHLSREKAPFTIVQTLTLGDLTCAENSDIHYMYDYVNGNGKSALRMYHMQYPDRRIPDHRFFLRLHRQLRETHSFRVTGHDADRQRAVRSSSLEEGTLNIVAIRPESQVQELLLISYTRGLLTTDHVILNHGQVTWTTPELAPPTLTTTPTGGRFSSRQI
ncbi:hypothetical protein TNCV_16581 [Trichonephila clavipes]|nr:hypothetical protein TNCV_16581 [Trichonephila clavipes]